MKYEFMGKIYNTREEINPVLDKRLKEYIKSVRIDMKGPLIDERIEVIREYMEREIHVIDVADDVMGYVNPYNYEVCKNCKFAYQPNSLSHILCSKVKFMEKHCPCYSVYLCLNFESKKYKWRNEIFDSNEELLNRIHEVALDGVEIFSELYDQNVAFEDYIIKLYDEREEVK